VHHPVLLCTAVKLDERAVEADSTACFDASRCGWWSASAAGDDDDEPHRGSRGEWLVGTRGCTLAGHESAVSVRRLAAVEECTAPQGEHGECGGEAAYAAARRWLYRTGGLLESCARQVVVGSGS
jgi:hypothetical protein